MPPRRTTSKLPPYTRLVPGRGYRCTPYVAGSGRGARRTTITLAPEGAALSEVWAAYEARVLGLTRRTLRDLVERYLDSPEAQAQTAYRQTARLGRVLLEQPTGGGVPFGDRPAKGLRPHHVRQYLRAREQEGKAVSGNREVGVLAAAWRWAREVEGWWSDPFPAAKKNAERPRDRYVTDAEYEAVLADARARSAPYVALAAELAYLCRARRAEVCAMTRDDVTERGVLVRRAKGSRTTIALWTPRLRAVVAEALALPRRPGHLPARRALLVGASGRPVRPAALSAAWDRLMARVVDAGGQPWHFHDLKAKGATDFQGADVKAATGHRSDSSVAVYLRGVPEAEATR